MMKVIHTVLGDVRGGTTGGIPRRPPDLPVENIYVVENNVKHSKCEMYL